MDKYSYLSNLTPESVDALYSQYLSDENSVEFGWKKFFEGFEFARKQYDLKPGDAVPQEFAKEFRVMALINGYRTRGHLFTKTNPVRARRTYAPDLSIENFGLTQQDLSTVFNAGSEIGLGPAPLSKIISYLEDIYCQHIGIEFMYIRDLEKMEWLKSKFDSMVSNPPFSKDKKKLVLKKLYEAVGFEKFLHKKFVGQKRFSLEGGESLIPCLEFGIQKGAELGIREFVIGMAHRGRLNVLSNIFRKPNEKIFSEFAGNEYDETNFDGDVKYHLGFNSSITANNGESVKLNLLPNPSHLETVAAVAEGLSRAKIDQDYNGDYNKLAPIIIHGDAAVAGQGIVYEIIQMSKLEGYKTGGTIHLVINNQVGFTTNYLEARSSTYCTDIAKVVLAPVLHVNADDAEAVVKAIELAMEYRQRYHEDIFIDLLGYRKHGHNEGDEPRFTQPILYKAIEKHADPYQIYLKKLSDAGDIDSTSAKAMETAVNSELEKELEKAKAISKGSIQPFLGDLYADFRKATIEDFAGSPQTGVSDKILRDILAKINALPADKSFLKKISKIFGDRQEMVKNDKLDWALGELLAYATLLLEGRRVRLSGQDSVRGTFSHRHAIVKLEDSEEEYTPLNYLSDKQGTFKVYNSHLSEYGVLGFDYGYALGSPEGLTLWEAQFGDFNNGAQIVIDQYISAAEDKWKTQNNLVMLLPHGYEGQGAEHSSARLERFLNLAAELNMQIVNCTTPANFYHALRRQVARPFRKPLIVMTPKSLLRHPECVSSIHDFATGGFQEIIDDAEVNPKEVEKVVLCSGKIYYELAAKRRELQVNSIALVRLEQLFPFPSQQMHALVEKYGKAESFVWVQEEPENMGAWGYLLRVLRKGNPKNFNLDVIAHPASASPATGSPKLASIRQKAIIEKVFSPILVH